MFLFMKVKILFYEKFDNGDKLYINFFDLIEMVSIVVYGRGGQGSISGLRIALPSDNTITPNMCWHNGYTYTKN